jgi:transporter family-2 protein
VIAVQSLVLAFAIGCMIPLQAAINNQLKGVLGQSTLLAAFVSFGVGTLALGLAAMVTGQRVALLGNVAEARAWQLAGGLLGAFFVFGTTLLAPRIGVAKMTALLVAGQVVISIIMDRGGWLGLPVRELSFTRVAGAILVVAGVVLVNFDQLSRK